MRRENTFCLSSAFSLVPPVPLSYQKTWASFSQSVLDQDPLDHQDPTRPAFPFMCTYPQPPSRQCWMTSAREGLAHRKPLTTWSSVPNRRGAGTQSTTVLLCIFLLFTFWVFIFWTDYVPFVSSHVFVQKTINSFRKNKIYPNEIHSDLNGFIQTLFSFNFASAVELFLSSFGLFSFTTQL